MRFLARSLTGLFLLVLTLALLGAAALLLGGAIRASLQPGGPGQPAEERVVAANVTRLEPTRVTPVLTAYGKVEARRALDLRARQSGSVVWVAEGFRNGLSVRSGEVLVRLDPAPAQEALALAQADLAEATASDTQAQAAVILARDDLAAAEAQVVLRRQALDRQRQIEARGAGSSQAVETAELALSAAEQAVLSRRQALAQAEAAVDQAKVAVTRAGIALAEAERALSETEIRAGLSGRVDGVALVPGALVGANEVIGRIIDPSALDVAVRLSTAQFALLVGPDGALGPAPVTLGAAGLTGRLERAAAAVAEGQTGRMVYVALDPSPAAEALLQPGDFVEVRIEEPPLADVARLPALAVGRNGTLLALAEGDRLQEIPVEVLRRQGDDVLVRVAALAGREVVLERSALLGEGIRIRPVRPGAGAGLVPLSEARRAELVALVEADAAMPEAAKARLLDELKAGAIPAATLERLEGRTGG
ncbi:efflux RND transporter periplasmic adaptor subunit [Tabrizicola soli]|uniref:Efflux RND transporter periplasmic adaptor subunit n=1 Tax=Tabrizicola soli TaxID=2185115 RepID=A0ABV7DQP5_9RHOB|nr:HlyD family efflux transporter periplasmic adaptor subunit [Tabrizicola soli]